MPKAPQRAASGVRGMVRCCSGHAPLSMQGKARKDHRPAFRLKL
jgi:hypothetical protein